MVTKTQQVAKNLNFKYYPNHELGMAGRFVLLAFTVTVMGPWAKRFLPVRTVKQALWLGPPETGDDRRDDAGREARRGIAFSRRRRMRLCHYAGASREKSLRVIVAALISSLCGLCAVFGIAIWPLRVVGGVVFGVWCR